MTGEQFVIAVVNRELKLVNADISAKTALFNDNQPVKWFNRYSFKTVKEFIDWRSYCYQLMRKYKPHYSKAQRYDFFNWINLQCGLRCDFDYELIPKYEKHKLQLKKDFGNSEECMSMS